MPTSTLDCILSVVGAYVDGSHIYGSDDVTSASVRTFKNGKLRVKVVNKQDFLPEWNDSSQCFHVQDGDYCFLAGDTRVNVWPGLNAMHTVRGASIHISADTP